MPDVNFLKKSVVKVQQRSAFDKSFRNLLTTKCGTLTPILCDEVIPNTTANLKLAINCTLPPLASETFMNVNLKVEAFFCPSRLLMLGFERFIQGDTEIRIGSTDLNATSNKLRVPVVSLVADAATTTPYVGPGKLIDYLGMRSNLSGNVDVCAFPFLAYHLIWDTWYRNSLIQKSAFDDGDFMNTSLNWSPRAMKYRYPTNHATYGYKCSLGWQFADGVHIGDLRQRNFGSDYFTVATTKPQKGNPSVLKMNLPQELDLYYNSINAEAPIATATGVYAPRDSASTTGDESGTISVSSINDAGSGEAPYIGFTIASLRAANSLQQWLERNNIAGNRLVDFVKAQYNADLKDSIAQRPVYLGSASFPVYSKGIYQTAKDSGNTNNPFNSVGSRYGHAYAEGTDFIIDHFTAEEPGYIMVLASLVPEVTYSGGINKYFMRYTEEDSYGEMANPILQNIGPEPIRCYEFDNNLNGDDSFGIFGYTDRYASWMTRHNELHGLLRDGQSLDSFALQRTGLTDGISSEFLTIPTNYMNQVTAVDSSISNYGCWIDCYLDYKVVMPLAKYSVPSLQDPAYEHGDTVVLDRAGRHID